MNHKELAVCGMITIAGMHRHGEWWCTAQEMVETLYDDDPMDRFLDERKVLGDRFTTKRVGFLLRGMAGRREPLVEKRRVRGVNQWRMTSRALSACVA